MRSKNVNIDKPLLKRLLHLNAVSIDFKVPLMCLFTLLSLQLTFAQSATTQEPPVIYIVEGTVVSNIENVAALVVSVNTATTVSLITTLDSKTEIVEHTESHQRNKSLKSKAVAKATTSTHSNAALATTEQVFDKSKNSGSTAFFSIKNNFVNTVPSTKLYNSAILNQYFKERVLSFSAESATCPNTYDAIYVFNSKSSFRARPPPDEIPFS